ncbi:hypothetical protein B0H17DRAFT_1288310 [Mycena rosella]|uniref:Uncharacterized protein n=1 Tax=Mycena rosella TaxID=1033263 RepID=A0AAD7DJE7_MYCRO|nr:hypothetical protein B0H17DRAFT_1288310 [Mycena rosella]
MSFPSQFTPASGPNDPPIPQLTPQQYAFAIQQYHYQQQLQMAPPPQPPQLPFPASVIDPALDSPQVPTTDQRLELLEGEIEQLKSQKRGTSSPDAGLPKRRRKNPKPSPHILKKATGLSTKQMEVRTSLMKKVKSELKNLTGRANNDDSASDSDDSDAPNISPTLPFAFAANIDDPVNVKVIDRAVHLVWTEQHDPRAETFSLPHRDIKFTREDLAKFAKTIFRGWKRTWKAETDPALAKKKAETESKSRQEMRRKEGRTARACDGSAMSCDASGKKRMGMKPYVAGVVPVALSLPP